MKSGLYATNFSIERAILQQINKKQNSEHSLEPCPMLPCAAVAFLL